MSGASIHCSFRTELPLIACRLVSCGTMLLSLWSAVNSTEVDWKGCEIPERGSWDSGGGARANLLQNCNQLGHLFWIEDSVHPPRAVVRERRLVELPHLHPAALGQVIDDEMDELNLIGIQHLSRNESGEGSLGSLSVKSDQRTNKKAKPIF